MWDIISGIVGVVGCITGTVSIVILIKQRRFNEGKLIVEQLNDSEYESLYFETSKYASESSYKTNYSAAVSLKIVNRSAYPTSISEIAITHGSDRRSHDSNFELKGITYPIGSMRYLIIGFAPSAKLPILLKPFETVYVSAMFPFFDCFAKSDGSSVKACVEVVTAKKPVNIKITIPEIDSRFSKKARTTK